MTTTNTPNLFIDVMNLNSNCQHEVVFDATNDFIYQVSILENRLASACERGNIKPENMKLIDHILVAIEEMNQNH